MPKSRMISSTPSKVGIFVAVLAFMLATVADVHAAKSKKKKKKKQEDVAILAGTVMSQAGEPLSGVAVTAILVEAEFRADAETDKKGEFEIEVPGEGDVMMKLAKDGYAAREDLVPLTLGEQAFVTVELLDAAAGRRSEAIRAYNSGAEAYEARDMALAKERFLAATAADPSLAEPFLVLADVHMVEGEHAEAAAAIEKFLELKPGDEKGQMLAYEAYQKLGNQAKLDELREELGKTDLAPQLAIQVYNEGAIADQKGDVETAIEKFRTALDLDPNRVEAHAGLATVYYRVGRLQESLVSIEALLAAKPEHAQGHRLRFLIHDGLGDREASNKAMDAYTGVDPKGAADLLYKRADLDFRAGELDLARASLQRVLELDPELAVAHYTLGKIYASTDINKAKEHLQKFLQMAPDDPEAPSAKEMLRYF